MMTLQIKGVALEKVWDDLETLQQDLIIGQLARWTMELFQHHFAQIGSLYPIPSRPGAVRVGPIIQPLFYTSGRSEYKLDRGPFPSARDFLSGCAARELDCTRLMFSQDTSRGYQERYEEEKINVERSMNLFEELIQRCAGLDEGDEMAPFSLDIHDVGLKSFMVDVDDCSKLVWVEWLLRDKELMFIHTGLDRVPAIMYSTPLGVWSATYMDVTFYVKSGRKAEERTMGLGLQIDSDKC